MRINETGKKYGYLTVTGFYSVNSKKESTWMTVCDCGNKKIVTGSHLRKGAVKSCGCKRKEMIGNATCSHRMSKTKTYGIWNQMIQRCNNPKVKAYRYYGEKGIRVCDEWLVFDNFYRDIGEIPDGLSIDRIDSTKGYSKENCKLSTKKEQNNNKSSNLVIDFNGTKRTVAEWAEILKINRTTLVNRIYNLKWSVDKSFNTVVCGRKRNKSFKNKSLLEESCC